jgi:translation initiation factor IF-3
LAIARGRVFTQQTTGKRLRINDQIRISPVRLIDEDNEQIGVIELDDAQRRAKDAGLDLVEVSGASRPPVCRIMDYGKWKYQQKKKEQKARSHSKQSELKEVRLRPKIDDHDLLIKTNKAKQFLTEGDKVQFTMQFRGREMAHRDLGFNTLREISETLAEISKVETMPRMAAGRRMTMVLVPDHRSNKSGKQPATSKPVASKPAAPKPAAPPPAADEGAAMTASQRRTLNQPPAPNESTGSPPIASDPRPTPVASNPQG